MLRTVKCKPLEKVCLGLASETFAGDIVTLWWFIANIATVSSAYYDWIIWCHSVHAYVSEGLT